MTTQEVIRWAILLAFLLSQFLGCLFLLLIARRNRQAIDVSSDFNKQLLEIIRSYARQGIRNTEETRQAVERGEKVLVAAAETIAVVASEQQRQTENGK